MWIDTPNRVEQSDAVSPLNHDINGAFSRSGKVIKKINRDPQWLDTLLVILFIFFLPAIDFILFAGSGDLQIVSENLMPTPEAGIVLLGILAVSAILVLPFYERRRVKYILASLMIVSFIYIIFRQFFLYQHGLSLGCGPISVSVILALLTGAATFMIFRQKRVFFKVLYVMAFAVMFLHVYTAYSGKAENKDFEETYNIQKPSDEPAERFIYFMLPNFEPYAFLSMMNTDEARTTQDIMQGFYQKNKFRVFDKAYVPENNYYANMIRSFNPTSGELSMQHRMNTKLLDRYWSFHNLKNEYIFIKNNELYDIFRKNDFQISAYKSRDFDMCHQQHKFNVERCVEKLNKPINLYNTQLPIMSRAGILAVDWLASMRLFSDASFIYDMLGAVMDIEDVPMVGTDFNNLYVVNADKTFDVLLENIRQDTGRQAYFVFVDLPSDMYIYDEYCQIKPQNEWVTMVNLPWIRSDYKEKRQKAYLQQMRCLYGKMEEFMDNLGNDNMLQNTTVIVQGTSGVGDFSAAVSDVSVEQILNNRIVNMAVYQSDRASFAVDERFCATNQILTEYLYPEQKCDNDLIDYHQKMVETVNSQLEIYNRNIKVNRTATFDKWYKTWQEYNQNRPQPTIDIANDKTAEHETYGIDDINALHKQNPTEDNIAEEANIDNTF